MNRIPNEGSYFLAVVSTDGRGDRAGGRRQGWAAALRTYREAVDIYRRVLELQARRQPRFDLTPRPDQASEQANLGVPVTEDGSTSLTRREWQVAGLIARGSTNREIAETLVLTRGTVANHVAHILGKLNASNRTQIAAYFLRVAAPTAEPADMLDSWAEERIRRVS